MIKITPEVKLKIDEKKSAYWSAKGVKIKPITMEMICANCMGKGKDITLKKSGNIMTCINGIKCMMRRANLSGSDLNWLDTKRQEIMGAR